MVWSMEPVMCLEMAGADFVVLDACKILVPMKHVAHRRREGRRTTGRNARIERERTAPHQTPAP